MTQLPSKIERPLTRPLGDGAGARFSSFHYNTPAASFSPATGYPVRSDFHPRSFSHTEM
jgi:hypothetical protein